MPSLVSPTSLLRPPRAKIAFSEPVCMVIPPSVFLLDERVFMKLGILKVVRLFGFRAGYAVEVLDLAGIENFLDVVELHCRPSATRIVALRRPPRPSFRPPLESRRTNPANSAGH